MPESAISHKQASCEDRIEARMAGRLADILPNLDDLTETECRDIISDIRQLTEHEELDEWREEAREVHQERLYGLPLCIEELRVYEIQLSTGGPADSIELTWSPTAKGWLRGRYIFQDWFDGASRTLSQEVAEQIAEAFGIYP